MCICLSACLWCMRVPGTSLPSENRYKMSTRAPAVVSERQRAALGINRSLLVCSSAGDNHAQQQIRRAHDHNRTSSGRIETTRLASNEDICSMGGTSVVGEHYRHEDAATATALLARDQQVLVGQPYYLPAAVAAAAVAPTVANYTIHYPSQFYYQTGGASANGQPASALLGHLKKATSYYQPIESSDAVPMLLNSANTGQLASDSTQATLGASKGYFMSNNNNNNNNDHQVVPTNGSQLHHQQTDVAALYQQHHLQHIVDQQHVDNQPVNGAHAEQVARDYAGGQVPPLAHGQQRVQAQQSRGLKRRTATGASKKQSRHHFNSWPLSAGRITKGNLSTDGSGEPPSTGSIASASSATLGSADSSDGAAKNKDGDASRDKDDGEEGCDSGQEEIDEEFDYEPILTKILNEKKLTLTMCPGVIKFINGLQSKRASNMLQASECCFAPNGSQYSTVSSGKSSQSEDMKYED